jgi:predicted MFS family arabinose efflux permease
MGSIGQDYVPLAANFAPEAQKGKAVGTVTTGLLSGILLSRAVGGWVAESLSWRAMQDIAALMMLAVAVITWAVLPPVPPAHKSSYGSLLASLWTLWRKHRTLRLVIMTQAILAATLGAFWSSLALVLAGAPFHQGPGVAGAFGFAGAAGALAAPLFGGFADKGRPLLAVRIGCVLVIIAFAGLIFLPPSLWLMALGALVFDLGVMAAFVPHQAMVSRLDPSASSRLNGLLMAGAMCGMAAGAAAGAWALQHHGHQGLWAVGIVTGSAGLIFSFFHSKRLK